MIYAEFIEQQPNQLSVFCSFFDIKDVKRASNIVRRLILAGIAKACSNKENNDDQDDVIHGEYIKKDLTEDFWFKFTYVGIVEIEGFVIYCYPKFIKDFADTDIMRQVIHAMERYNAEHVSLYMSSEEYEEQIPNQLAMALTILRDYFTYGIYSNQRDELVQQGVGDIDWEVTIDTTMPMIREGKPYYFDYFTYDSFQDETNYISRLHTCIISECSRLLRISNLAEILQLNTPSPYNGKLIDFGTNDYIIQCLRKELNVQFVSHKQATLKNMLAWVDIHSFSTEDSGILMFGSSHFHTVWEQMCRDVFCDQRCKPLEELGIALDKDYQDKKKQDLLSLISFPEWHLCFNGENTNYPVAETLKPDFITITKRKGGEAYLVIFDAKYYDLFLTKDKISGQPGVGDISKQFLYEMAYSDFREKHNLKSLNAFLFPTNEQNNIVKGYVNMPIFQGQCKVILISGKWLLSAYIENKRYPLDFCEIIPELFIQPTKLFSFEKDVKNINH